MTFDDVLEEHRRSIGAEKVHVTLGPDATPERLRGALADLRARSEAYGSFTEAERLAAEVARLRKLVSRLGDLAGDTRRGADERLSEISDLTDMVADVDLDEDMAFMAAERRKRGEPLPEAALAFV